MAHYSFIRVDGWAKQIFNIRPVSQEHDWQQVRFRFGMPKINQVAVSTVDLFGEHACRDEGNSALKIQYGLYRMAAAEVSDRTGLKFLFVDARLVVVERLDGEPLSEMAALEAVAELFRVSTPAFEKIAAEAEAKRQCIREARERRKREAPMLANRIAKLRAKCDHNAKHVTNRDLDLVCSACGENFGYIGEIAKMEEACARDEEMDYGR